MAIVLYPHNENAYHAALAMLRETGKATVIHPTGTGKSFIGFKLCENFPEKRVCWLSPSEYIFRTQLENLAKESGFVPENIRFFTYARLMVMDADEIAAIRPDFIILDEFHRCGAEQWGQGTQALLNAYSDAPLLGLSATNIRFLDNLRDMVKELFDGYIASEISLGLWIQHQRSIRKGFSRGVLNEERIAKLNAIGMCWTVREHNRWPEYFAAADYANTFGHLNVPSAWDA